MQPDLDLAGIVLAATAWAGAWTLAAWAVNWAGFTGLNRTARKDEPKE